ncbi:phage major capsid protein [Desulfovibrio psychrotolerans]|uniref:phage major capsid protein n=1 Tax=Desulfovibrio psychrotolerans TaxID=415242 RepID=UPI00157B5E68|nr:phage major capsid protein [Desulfovibrio psychrotolerans]
MPTKQPEQTKPTRDSIKSTATRAFFPIDGVRSVDEEKRTVEVAFSSDAEIEQWWRAVLVLEHSSNAVRLDRLNNGGAVLFNHDRNAHIAVVESARVDADGKGRAVVRFGRGKHADEKFTDVKDGILRHISVGFEVHELKLVEVREDDTDVYRATDWEPYEISFVTIPLDPSVGVGRGRGGAPETETLPNMEERTMPNTGTIVSGGGAPQVVDEQAVREQAMQAERDRANTILTLGRQYSAPEDAEKFVRDNKTPEEFQSFLLKELDGRSKKPTPDEKNDAVGLSEQEVQRYSVVKVLRCLDPNNAHSKAVREAAALELEASEAAARRMGREATGIVIPPEVLRAPVLRTYSTSNAAAPHGGNLVSTDLLAGSFIEMLRKRTLLMQYGTQLAGLVGNVGIPKQLSGATGYVVGEDEDVPGSDGDFGQLNLTPTTVGALAEVTRRLLMQSSLDVEALIRFDLAKAVGLKIDQLGFYGTGVNEPLGIKNISGVNAVPFATSGKPTFAELVQMESEIAADDADVDNMAYIVNAKTRGHAKTTPKFANTEATIWEPGNTINGYNAGVTNQVAAADAFFGNFADLIIGMWGGLELTLDPYTHSAKGRLRIVAMQDVDIAARRAESFCVGTTA